MEVVIFDTETTGLIKPSANKVEDQPQIIEIFCRKVKQIDGQIAPVSEFSTFLCPLQDISAEITKITGITNDMVYDAPSFSQVYHELAEFFLGVERVVAHNLAFDRSMLANELVRIDKVIKFPWPIQHVCTVEKSMKYEQRRLNLQRLHEYLFATGFPNAHRAKTDVDALTSCYVEMVKRGDIL